jgi:hypothetical protein
MDFQPCFIENGLTACYNWLNHYLFEILDGILAVATKQKKSDWGK